MDKAIEKAVKRIDNQAAVAKYARLTWCKKQSGNFTADNTFLTKTGNKYLRYYLLEAIAALLETIQSILTYYQSSYI